MASVNPYQAVQMPGVNPSTGAMVLAPLVERAGWLRFIGITTIVYGGLTCLSIIGAVFGVPMIVAGINLFQAGASYRDGYPHNPTLLLDGSRKFSTAILILGILTAIGIGLFVLYILAVIAFFIIGAVGVAAGGGVR